MMTRQPEGEAVDKAHPADKPVDAVVAEAVPVENDIEGNLLVPNEPPEPQHRCATRLLCFPASLIVCLPALGDW